MSLYSRLDRLAADVEKLNKQVTAVSNQPQSQRTSVEGGSIDFNDADGNLKAIVGAQDDGSNTIRHVDGPTPPVPSGLSAHVDGPIVQVSWDGTFESDVTHDWHYLEVLAVGPNNEQLTGTINDLSGGETSLAATSQGDWFITARSVSRAGKRSLGGDAGTVAVQLVGLTGAIEAVQESANGKSTIYYSPTEPVAPEGGFNDGDLWFDTSEEGNNTASVWDGNGWVSMEDARLATIIAAQEALESELQDVQTSVDGKNTITYDPALPPASYVGAVGDTWYRTSGNSMIGFWKWDGAAWVQQALSTTVIPQIDIGAGTFGTLNGARLVAGSVAASSIAVGDFSNLATIDPVRNINVTRPSIWATVKDGDYIKPAAGTQQQYLMFKDRTNTVPFGPGDALRVKFTMNSPEAFQVRAYMWAYPSLEEGSSSGLESAASLNVDISPGLHEYTTTIPVPANFGATTILKSWVLGLRDAANISMRGAGVRDVSVYRMTGRTLIQDGAITTDKLAVGSITAESGVIASLDLGTATVGELDGIRIMGQSIRGEQLSGDAIDGKVITGPIIQSSRDGQRWVGDTTGIRIFNADNEVRTQLSPDGSVFKGEVEADSLVVNGGAELRGTDNTLAQGAKLTIAAGVTDPTAPPLVQPFWEGLGVSLGLVGGITMDPAGLAWDGTNYWTAYKDNQGTNGARSRLYIYRINGTTGVGAFVGGVLPVGVPWSSEIFGITCIGSELFIHGRYYYEGIVWVTDLSGAYLRHFSYPSIGYSATNPLTYKPGIGNDGTNVVIAQCDDNGPLNIRTYNKTTGALISRAFDTGGGTRSDITGVYVGNADWGRKLATVAQQRTNELTSFSITTGKYDGDGTKFQAAAAGSVGVVFHDGKFHTLDPAGVIHEYADANTGDASGDWWAAYRWSVDADNDGYNDYTSRISPSTRFGWPGRAKLKIIGAALPQGVGYISPSIAKKTTAPTRTDFRTPSWSVREGESVAWYDTLPSDWAMGSAPSDSNDFPEAESASLGSASNTFLVRGDGSGHWGPLTMGRNGVMSGLVVTGQAACAVDTAGTPKKFTIQLPAGRFTKPPVVWLSPLTSSPQNVAVSVVGADITTTSFALWFWRSDLSGTGVDWFAMDSE